MIVVCKLCRGWVRNPFLIGRNRILATGELWKQLKWTWKKLGAIVKMSSTEFLTVSVLKNIRTVSEFSGLEGCSLLLIPLEVFLYTNCRQLRINWEILAQKYTNTIFPLKSGKILFFIDSWKPGVLSKITPIVRTSGLGGIGKKKVSIRKICYDILWGLVAPGIDSCEWMSTFPTDWHCISSNLQALPVLKEGCHGAPWQSSLRMILEEVFSWGFYILEKIEADNYCSCELLGKVKTSSRKYELWQKKKYV